MANGFLDFLQTPAGIGLLSGVASYAANARKGTPINNVGRGLLGGLTGYTLTQEEQRRAADDAVNQQYRQMQIDEIKRKQAEQQAMREAGKAAAGNAFRMENVYVPESNTSPVMPGLSGAPDAIGDYSMDGAPPVQFNNRMEQRKGQFDPALYQGALFNELANRGMFDEAVKYAPKPKEPIKIGKNDRLLKPDTYEELVGAAPEPVDYNKPFLPDGTPNLAYQQFKTSDSRAGAPSIVTKIENKTGESMAGQVGPILKDSRIRAVGALKMADSADRLDTALKSGKVIAGPFATKRMFLNQLGAAMGISGPEAVTQTRQVIRSLAESSVEARKELQGQGQVTENEAKAVEKAMSGNIDDFTVPELQALVSLNKKAATFSAQQHQFLLDQARSDEATKGVARFYDVPGMSRLLKDAAPANSKVRKYNPATGRIE